MKINYKIENENFKVTFCPDKQKLSIKNKKNSYMQISKDLKKLNHDNRILLVNNSLTKHQLGRTIQRVLDIESYRSMLMVGLINSNKIK